MSAREDMARREERRATLAAVASSHERAARPGAPFYAAALLLLAAMVFLGVQLGSRAEAADRLRSEAGSAATVEQLALEIETARARAAATPTASRSDRFAPITDLLSRLERAAERAGIVRPGENFLPDTNRSVVPEDGFATKQIGYRLSDTSPEQAFEFIDYALRQAPGMHVRAFAASIGRPSARGRRAATGNESWNFEIEFERTERAQ